MKYFYLLLLLIFSNAAFGQAEKVYINSNGQYTGNPDHAMSYILMEKLGSDSGYRVRQYDMKGTIMYNGIYQDAMLTTPNGEFIYYHKNAPPQLNKAIKLTGVSPTDTANFIQSRGLYVNGKQSGTWITYASANNKQTECNYLNGVMEGSYKTFFNNGDWSEGKMVKGVLQGKYYTYVDSLLVTDIDYIDGAVVKTNIHIKGGVPSENLDSYLEKQLKPYKSIISKSLPPQVKIKIDKSGHVISSKIIKGINQEVDNAIQAALLTVPAFTPCTYDNAPIELKTTCILYLFDNFTFISTSTHLFPSPLSSFEIASH